MIASVESFVLSGIDPLLCEIEVRVATALADPEKGPPRPMVVGLPDAAVRESIERVSAAVEHSGHAMPAAPTTISLAPASIRKEGPVFDLPIAVGLLSARGAVPDGAANGLLMAGELALDGRVRPVPGVINMAILARDRGARGVIVPAANAGEAWAVGGVPVYPVNHLRDVIALLDSAELADPPPPPARPAAHDRSIEMGADAAIPDFSEIRGQEGVKRALVVAAAGAHNALMIGPPGSGKTMLARGLPGILPPLSHAEALETTRIHSVARQSPGGTLITRRPVRSPHHTASAAAIIGGGTHPRPGEVSLAHHGVLFLDELPEFPRGVLETLRQPLEDHRVEIARARASVSYPARFMLLAACNPTPRGYTPENPAAEKAMSRYLEKLSGPLVDRIDIHCEVPAVPHAALMDATPATPSRDLRAQVIAARAIQAERQGGALRPNATLTHAELDRVAPLDAACRSLMAEALDTLGLTARAYDKLRRVARTLADLAAAPDITEEHLLEALSYRILDRQTAGAA